MSDASNKQITSRVVGQQLFLATALSNSADTEMKYVLFTEVRNGSGVTISLQPRWGVIGPGENRILNHAWRPDSTGTFELRSFVVSAECLPKVLTAVDVTRLEVSAPDGSENLPPRLESLSEREVQLLTREEIEAIELEQDRLSDIDSEIYDADISRLEAKERRIREAVWSDERIKEYQRTHAVFGYDSEFVMDEQIFCDNAELTIPLSKLYRVEGDWQTSYIRTLSGRMELKVGVENGAIVSIIENPQDDSVTEHFFSEDEKQVIRLVLADEKVHDLIQHKEIQVGGVRTGGIFFNGCEVKCAIVVLYQKEDRDKAAVIELDVSNERVVSINPNSEWLSEER